MSVCECHGLDLGPDGECVPSTLAALRAEVAALRDIAMQTELRRDQTERELSALRETLANQVRITAATDKALGEERRELAEARALLEDVEDDLEQTIVNMDQVNVIKGPSVLMAQANIDGTEEVARKALTRVRAFQKRLIEEPPYDGDLVSVLKERNRTLQAEVAALREDIVTLEEMKLAADAEVAALRAERDEWRDRSRTATVTGMVSLEAARVEVAERELAKARALLAQLENHARDCAHCTESLRAFLRGDEPRRCTCGVTRAQAEAVDGGCDVNLVHAADCSARGGA